MCAPLWLGVEDFIMCALLLETLPRVHRIEFRATSTLYELCILQDDANIEYTMILYRCGTHIQNYKHRHDISGMRIFEFENSSVVSVYTIECNILLELSK